jgi:hypothetical protein
MKRRPPKFQIDLLEYREGVIDLDTEVAHAAPQLYAPKKRPTARLFPTEAVRTQLSTGTAWNW